MSENMKIINEIVCGVMDTPMWGKIATEDPWIEVRTLLTRYCSALPKQQRGEIEDAICDVGSAYTDAAFLYGVHIAQAMSTSLAVSPSLGSVVLAFGISVGIGILFGYLPARKAANLNPIDALHYD